MFDPRSSALNYVVINGVPSPGKAIITGAAIPYNYDVKPGYGLSGATTVFKGRGVAKFTLTIELWERTHFIAWELFKRTLAPPKPGIKLVCGIVHPILAQQDIKDVAIESVGQLERQTDGRWRVAIQCLEWRQPLPAIVKPRGAVPGVAGGKVIPPKTEADIALEKARLDFETARAAARAG